MINKLLMLAIVSFICAFSITELSAQKQAEEHKIVIIEKEIDDNGIVTEVKKVLEGEEAKAYMENMKGEDGSKSLTIDESSEHKKIRVIKKDGGRVEEMEFEWEGEEIPKEVKKLMDEQGLSLEELNGVNGAKRIKIMQMGESDKDMEVEVEVDKSKTKKKIKILNIEGGAEKEIEWEGDELPAEVKELLEKEGIDLKELEAGQGGKMVRVKKSQKSGVRKKAQLGINIEDHPSGVHVSNVLNESSAMEAGILVGDVITAIDEVTVTSPAELIAQIKDKQAGEVIKVKYVRGSENNDVSILLKEAVDPRLLRDKNWTQLMNGKEAKFRIEFHESLKK